jgi:hypothetical protein
VWSGDKGANGGRHEVATTKLSPSELFQMMAGSYAVSFIASQIATKILNIAMAAASTQQFNSPEAQR